MSQELLSSLLANNQLFLPPDHGKETAWIKSKEQYDAICKLANENPDKFWGSRAEELLHWFSPWNNVLTSDKENHIYKWFDGAKLNASYNCIDRHLIDGRRNKAALIWQGEKEMSVRCYTYQMLYTEVCRMAHALSSLRIRKGDRVVLYMPMIPELVIAMLACARIGAIHTAVFSGYADGGVLSRIQDSKAKVVITADATRRGGRFKPLKANLDNIIEKCPSVAHVVVVEHGGLKDTNMKRNRDIWWHDLIDDFTLDSDFSCEIMDSNDTLFLLHTSGSTGKPSGIMHSTGGYLTYAAHTTQWVFDVHDDDVYWCTADIGWITGHTYAVYGPLSLGATTVMFEGVPTWPNPDRYWKLIERYRVNVFYTAPTVIRSLMRYGEAWLERNDLSSLRILGSVGEPINPEAWQWYHAHVGQGQLPLIDTWWQTETGGAMIAALPYVNSLKPGSATFPLPGIDAVVLNDKKGEEEDDGNDEGEGHLVIRKPWPGLMQGIFNNPEKYKSFFSRFDAYQSGDGACVDKDGYYWILGRIDDSLNVSGHRLSTVEIETALTTHTSVAEAAVVAMPHELKGEAIYAYVALREDIAWTEDLRVDLRNTVRNAIGALASPEYIQFVDHMPKTCSGKIIRRVLRKIAAGNYEELGDLTSLAKHDVLPPIIEGHKNVINKKHEKIADQIV